jgi:hypothetical protein
MVGDIRRSSDRGNPAWERIPLILITGLLALRVLYLFMHAVDSDEPQNLHVIYRWLDGALPYRDQFDNHTPLFHWMFLPFAAFVGENADVVALARLALVPLSFGVVGLIYALARRLYDRRTALWGVAILLALADWSLKSIEFRPDILWMALWFGALWVLVRPNGRPGPMSFFLAGLLLGASASASVKTAFLLPGLALGWAAAWILSREFRALYPWKMILQCAVTGALGFVIVPGIIAAYFAFQGALDEMIFCVYAINKDPFLTSRSWIFLAAIPFICLLAFYLVRQGGLISAYRAAVFLAAAVYALAIIGFGPFESLAKQTFLAAYPLLVATGCHVVLTFRRWNDRQAAMLGTSVCAALGAVMLVESPPFRHGMAEQRGLLTAILEKTKPDEYVMDIKGETIFRRRPIYLAYVGITKRAIDSRRLQSPDPAGLQNTRTAFAIESTASFPEAMRSFLKQNYLRTMTDELRVAGKLLKPSWESGNWIERARVEIPGTYVIVANGAVVAERVIQEPSEQVFDFEGSREQRFLFWKPAWERGLRPTRDD